MSSMVVLGLLDSSFAELNLFAPLSLVGFKS